MRRLQLGLHNSNRIPWRGTLRARPGSARKTTSFLHTTKALIILFTLTMFAGGYGLARISVEFVSLGELQYIRTWFMLALTGAIIGLLLSRKWQMEHYGLAGWWAILIAILHIYLTFSSVWAPQPALALALISQVMLVAILIVFVLPIFSPHIAHNTTFFLFLILGASLLYALGGIAGYGAWSLGNTGRMAAFGGGPNVFVRIMCMGMFIAVFFANLKRSWYFFLPIPILLICALLSGSRGGLIAFTITFPLFLFFVLPGKGLKRLFPLLFTIALFGAAYPFVSATEAWQKVVGWRFSTATFEEGYGLDGRLSIFDDARQMFLDHPVGGVGFDGFRQSNEHIHAHNLFLQFAAEGGSIALILLGLLFVMLLLSLFRRQNILQITLIAMGFYHLLAGMWSGSYFDARWMWLFFLLYLLTIAQPSRKPSSSTVISRSNNQAPRISPDQYQ